MPHFRRLRVVALAGLPLAAVVLAVFLLSWGNGSTQKAHAAVDANVNFNLSATGCNTDSTTTKCAVPGGSTFTVSFNVTSANTAGYGGYDMNVAWSGNVNYLQGSLKQTGAGVWPACAKPAKESHLLGTAKTPATTPIQLGNGSLSTVCAVGVAAGPSTYLGTLASFQMVCKSSGLGTVSLVHGDGNTDLVDFNFATHSEAAPPAVESLTVNCLPVTPTATPPPVGGISLDNSPNGLGPETAARQGSVLSGVLLMVIGGSSAIGALLLSVAAWRATRWRTSRQSRV